MPDSFFFRGGALPRRTFLRVAGASAAPLLLAGCGSDGSTPVPTNPNLLRLSSGDGGLLNYLYLLEQLEAAFYQKIIDAPPADWRAGEKAFFDDLRDHELIHRETLRYALGTNAYDALFERPLAFDFTSLSLTTRAGVLAAAQQFEDLGVAAYAGVLRLVNTTVLIALLAKIASTEARHAALVRDLRTPGSFADEDMVVSAGSLQHVSVAKTPAQVMTETQAFFRPIVVSTDLLPTA